MQQKILGLEYSAYTKGKLHIQSSLKTMAVLSLAVFTISTDLPYILLRQLQVCRATLVPQTFFFPSKPGIHFIILANQSSKYVSSVKPTIVIPCQQGCLPLQEQDEKGKKRCCKIDSSFGSPSMLSFVCISVVSSLGHGLHFLLCLICHPAQSQQLISNK